MVDFICFLMTFSFLHVQHLSPKHNSGNTNKIERERERVCVYLCDRERELGRTIDVYKINRECYRCLYRRGGLRPQVEATG